MDEAFPENWDPTTGGSVLDYGLDTAPTGAGGDPYGTNLVPAGGSEEWSTGMLPGGPDGQFTPYSPGGGFDFTNLFRGLPSWLMARGRQAAGLPNPGALAMGQNPMIPYGPDDSTGTYHMGGSSTFDESGDTPHGGRKTAALVVRQIRQSTGLRVTARSIVNLIVRYGFKATSAMTGADAGSLLTVFMVQKGTTHHRRGPGLYTLARKFRKYESLKRTVARVLGRGGGGTRHYRRRHPFHRRRRHRR